METPGETQALSGKGRTPKAASEPQLPPPSLPNGPHSAEASRLPGGENRLEIGSSFDGLGCGSRRPDRQPPPSATAVGPTARGLL